MIFEKLQDMIADQLGINKDKIQLNSNIAKDIGADSLDIVEMLMTIEENWDIVIDDSEITGIQTIEDVVKFIESKI